MEQATEKLSAIDFIKTVIANGAYTKINSNELQLLTDILDNKILMIAQSIIDLEEAKKLSEDSKSLAERDLNKEAEAAALTIFSLKMIGYTAIMALKADSEKKSEAAEKTIQHNTADNDLLSSAHRSFFQALEAFKPSAKTKMDSLQTPFITIKAE